MGSTNSKRVSDAHKAKVETLNAAPEPAAKKAQRDRNKKVLEMAADLLPQEHVKRFAELKQAHVTLLDGLSNAVTSELANFNGLAEATRLAREQLEATHEIVAQANSLSALILAQDEQRAAFEQEMAKTRALWDEQEKELSVQRKREKDNYDYITQQARRKDNDEWNTEKTRRLQEFDSELNKRKELIESRELIQNNFDKELLELREKAATADARQDAEVKKQVQIACNSVKKEMEHAAALERLSLQNSNNLLAQQIQARDSSIQDLTVQLKLMTEKYQEAALRVQAIAERAVDSAASRPTYFTAPMANGNESAKRN